MKKLTPSKMLSSMALATLLVAAAGTQTAKAADFSIDAGNAGNGQQATQSTIQYGDPSASTPQDQMPKNATGDIEITGTFTKTITNLPTPDQAGRYLRVTMPITLDYTYNVDTNTFVGATGVIQNQSVYATGTAAANMQLEAQPINMTFVGLTAGNSTTDATVNYVNSYNAQDTDIIQLPIQLSLSGASTAAKSYTFADIENKQVQDTIQLQGGANVSLGIELIPGQTVGNTDLIKTATTFAKHDLTLQFEYDGK